MYPLIYGVNASHVNGPTIPSGTKPNSFWKFCTAVCVRLPNIPSILDLKNPIFFSVLCRSSTQGPL